MSIEMKNSDDVMCNKVVNAILNIFIERYLLQSHSCVGASYEESCEEVDGYRFSLCNSKALICESIKAFKWVKLNPKISYFWCEDKDLILQFFKDYPECILGRIDLEQIVRFFLSLMGKE